jgi:hypothetical protein
MATKAEIDALFEEADALSLVDEVADEVTKVDLGEGPEGAGTMTVRTRAPKGYHPLYDYVSGRPVNVALRLIPQALRRRDRQTGAPLYSKEPTKPYVSGSVPCLLHPAHPEREYYDQIGLDGKVCTHMLRSKLDQRRHMQIRHKDEWALVQAEEERETRELQVALLRQQIGAKK